MNCNKIKRVKSANFLKDHEKSRLQTSVKLRKNIFLYERQVNQDQISNINKNILKLKTQSTFRETFKKLSTDSSIKSLKNKQGRVGYNSETWRVVNSARSQQGLKKIKNTQEANPIKLNLEQKVLRIKLKHNQSRSKNLLSIFRKNPQQRNFMKKSEQQRKLSNKVHQIVKVWQNDKAKEIERYVNFLTARQQNLNLNCNTYQKKQSKSARHIKEKTGSDQQEQQYIEK